MSRDVRNEAFFGALGQERIRETAVAIVGSGGLGSHVAQQLAYLGTTHFALIDHDSVDTTNLNRLIGATPLDVGRLKVEVAERLIQSIRPGAEVSCVSHLLQAPEAQAAISASTVVFGCLDDDASRLDLLESCRREGKILYDLATDILLDGPTPHYGGRVVRCDGQVCLVCLDVLDQQAIRLKRMSPEDRAVFADVYGIDVAMLGTSGPAVVTLNGVVASLATTEFMLDVSGIRPARQMLTYRAEEGVVRPSIERPDACYYCDGWGDDLR